MILDPFFLIDPFFLKLDCSKAHNRLQWWPKWDLRTALKMIVEWHKIQADESNMRKICIQQISQYQTADKS